MSTKPAKVPRWGATAPGTITGTVVEPSEAKKTVGFVSRERPPAAYFMWLFELIYEWLQYLMDANFSGASTFDSTLGIAGNTTVGGTLGVTGAVTAASTLAVTSNATVGGTLGVTGAVTASSTLAVASNATVGGTLGVTGNATVGGTLHVTGKTTYSEDFYTNPRTVVVGITPGMYTATTTVLSTGVPVSAAAGRFVVPMPVRTSEVVTHLSFWVSGDGLVDLTWVLTKLHKTGASSVATTEDSGTLNNVGGGTGTTSWQEITSGPLTTIAAGDSLVLDVTVNAANLAFSAVEMSATRPF